MADDSDDHESTYQEFRNIVNMTAGELEKWLSTGGSKEVARNPAALLAHELGPRPV
jgi:Protein of unknown function (DUF3140)